MTTPPQMHCEIERKFLITQLPPSLSENESAEIRQGYISVDAQKEVRIRHSNNSYTLAVKGGSGLSRSEVEVAITPEEFETLWPLTKGHRLTKTRWIIPWGEHTVELDIYSDHHAPLMVAEVEFESIEASKSFTPPAYFGKEITGDTYYKNCVLSGK